MKKSTRKTFNLGFKMPGSQIRKIISIFTILISVALLAGLSIREAYTINGALEPLYPETEFYFNGYKDVSHGVLVPINQDPQLGFIIEERTVSAVRISFAKPVKEGATIQVFYASKGEGLREENSVTIKANGQDTNIVIPIPPGNFSQLRFDINGTANLLRIDTSPEIPSFHREAYIKWKRAAFVLFVEMALVLLLKIIKERPAKAIRLQVAISECADTKLIQNKTGRSSLNSLQNFSKGTIIVCAFLSYLLLALHMPESLAPDEAMRNDIPFWIFTNNSLPVGDEPELIDPVWGFSYGFSPYLPSILAVPLMKVFSFFHATTDNLIFATRLISVFASTASVFLCFKIGLYLFKRPESSFLFAILVGFLPQVVFISGYLNNDAFSLFTALLIFYFLLRGKSTHWSVKSCVGLSIAISLCALTYYFAYGWILFSVPFCIVSVLRDKTLQKKGRFILNRACLVATAVFLLTGWYFIRNAILYEGNFLARGAAKQCADAYEAAGHIIHKPSPPVSEGVSLYAMLFDMGWVFSTIKSMIGCFGYMSIWLSDKIYFVYIFILFSGFLCALCSLRKLTKNPDMRQIFALLFATLIIPVGLSVYYSYMSDYQPQGRYIISAFPAIAVFTTYGYESLTTFIADHRKTVYVYKKLPSENDTLLFSLGVNPTIIIIFFWLALFFKVYISVMIPELIL